MLLTDNRRNLYSPRFLTVPSISTLIARSKSAASFLRSSVKSSILVRSCTDTIDFAVISVYSSLFESFQTENRPTQRTSVDIATDKLRGILGYIVQPSNYILQQIAVMLYGLFLNLLYERKDSPNPVGEIRNHIVGFLLLFQKLWAIKLSWESLYVVIMIYLESSADNTKRCLGERIHLRGM